MIFVFLLCLFFALISLITSKNNVLAPGVITSSVWIIVLSLFCLLNHNLPLLSWKFFGSLSIWITFLCLGSLFMQSVDFKVTNYKPSKLVRDLFFCISIIFYPFFLLYVREALLTGVTGNWAMDLRLASIGGTKHFKEVYGGIQVIFWEVTYLIELLYFSKKNRVRVFTLAIIILSFGLFTMSKGVFLDFFVKTICILFFRKKVSVKNFLIGLASLITIFVSLQIIRYSGKLNNFDAANFFTTYVVGNASAFDTLKPGSSIHLGENVFRIFYAINEKLGFSDIKPINTFLPFIMKPIITNTYTVMYPFFKDFGYWGVGFFAFAYGLIFGWSFKKAQKGSDMFILIFSILSIAIVMQYVADMFLTNISAYIKQIILISIPFLSVKYKLFNKNEI